MADRIPALVPRIAAIALLVLCATAGLTYAAGSSLPTETPAVTTAATPPPPLVVPDVRGQAYVFAKGTLEESGFGWRVIGAVKGYAANMVVAQSPVAGTKLIDTGTPEITLTLKRNAGYPQVGEADNASPFPGTVVQPAATEGKGPALPASAPAVTKPAVTTPAATTTTAAATPTPDVAVSSKPAKRAATWPQHRPPAFTVAGAAKEPLDEMPLPTRAKKLAAWLDAHPQNTRANVSHWLYQHAWIVTGAKMGWWRGAEALRTLAAVDARAERLWGVGAKSEAVTKQTLARVLARSKS